jgi:YD repeat-containing protein
MQKKISLILMAAASPIITAFTAHADDTFYRYDRNGNLSQIQSSNGGGTYYQHDANGNITSKYDDQGNVTYYSYDAQGNLTRTTHVDAAKPMAEPKPTPTFSGPQPIRSAPAPVPITPAPIPHNNSDSLANRIDDDATITAFLKRHGYKNPTPINIDLVRQYLSNHHLLHVSDIDQ